MLIFVVACSKLLKRFVDSCNVTRNKAGFCSCFLLVRITADVGVIVTDGGGTDGGGCCCCGNETSADESSSTYFNSFVEMVGVVLTTGEFVSNSDRVDDEDNVDECEYEDGVGDGLLIAVAVVLVVTSVFVAAAVVVVRKFFKFFKCCIVKELIVLGYSFKS